MIEGMLPEWIKEQIRKREEEKQRREQQQPTVEIEDPPVRPPEDGDKRPSWRDEPDEGERGYHEEQVF